MIVIRVTLIILDVLLGLSAINASEGNDEILGALFILTVFIFNAVLLSAPFYIGV